MADGLALGGTAGTITWTMDAATSALLPLGHVTASLRVFRPWLPPGCLSVWKLDEASGTRADSLGTNDLTETGTVGTTTGHDGLSVAAVFNSANEILTCAANADLQAGTDDLSIAAWVRLDAYTSSQAHLFGRFDAGLNEYLLQLAGTGAKANNYLKFYWVDTAGTTHSINCDDTFGLLDLATWYKVIVWKDATLNTINIQVGDGEVFTLSGVVGGQSTASTFAIGASLNPVNPTHPFAGAVQLVVMARNVWTQSQRRSLFEGGGIDTASGVFQVLDPATTFESTTNAFLLSDDLGWAVTASEATLVQGDSFSTVLTVRDSAGSLVDLTDHYATLTLYYEPEGSSTRIKPFIPLDTILTGTVTYKDISNANAPWPNVTVSVTVDGNAQPDVTTNASGVYEIVGIPAGSVVVSVSATAPARGAQAGSNTGTTVLYTTTTVNVTCQPVV